MRYERGPSDEIGALLGSMSVLEDGEPADAAHAQDWEKAVRTVMAAEATSGGYRGADFELS